MRLAWVTLAAMVGCSGAAGASLGPVGDDPGVDAGGATTAMAQQRGDDAEVDAIDAGGGDPPAADADGGPDAGVRADAQGDMVSNPADGAPSPDAGTPVRLGAYHGAFSCLFYYQVDAGVGSAPDSGGVGPITGSLSFEVAATDAGTNREATGAFDTTTGLFIALSASMTGACSDAGFSGTLDGDYGFNLAGMPAPDPNNKFQGPIISSYDSGSSSFVDGQWSMEIAGYGPCIGAWTASYVGPSDAGADAL